jgi:glycosyltransferase involved in cell wall biosynthesis
MRVFETRDWIVMAQRIVIDWNFASFTGWGMFGLNLVLHWADDPRIEAVTTFPVKREHLVLDPLRLRALQPFFERSLAFQADLQALGFRADQKASTMGRRLIRGPVLMTAHSKVFDLRLEGNPTIGNAFCEEPVAPHVIEGLRHLPLILTGSTWNEQLLRAYGIDRVRTLWQGIDPTAFHPGPKLGLMRDRFLIFSGGKAELRKGQDIVLAAFKVFAESHPEAMLVTLWHSPWPQLARSFERAGIVAPVVFNAAGQLDLAGWAAANQIPPDRVLDLGIVANLLLPPILREMDVAVFTNRAEAGTNLIAMECMALGLPVILSRNTGHTDLIEDGNCYPLEDQQPARAMWQGFNGVSGWGESRVDEVVARLEEVFSDRAEAKRRGERGAQTVATRTWAETARQMAQTILDFPQSNSRLV